MTDKQTNDRLLPRLHPLIRLYKGPDKPDGTPSWTLYHPAAHRYFQIGWAEFECLARMDGRRNAQNLIDDVNRDTPLTIDEDDVRALMIFLDQNGLLAGASSSAAPLKNKAPLWKTVLHRYLFFSIPLIRPQKILDLVYPVFKPMLGRGFITAALLLLIILIPPTIARSSEFFHTFLDFMSLEGVLLLFATLFTVKIFHECGHALTARHYGVNVAHMGIAFMVMYPVLYTETSAAWQLQNKKARLHIGLAGIMTELALAAFALLLWHILLPGTAQSLAFSVVVIALAGSLLVNLNPLMRFDGYFVLSDALGIENLHAKGFAAARWWLRKKLFGLLDTPPDDAPRDRLPFLIVFGWATIIYRFFLFVGIALLVYWLFFKPLGLILMIAELYWFIAAPALREIKVWWERREGIWARPRGKVLVTGLLSFFVLLCLPIGSHVTVPAMMHAATQRSIYPPDWGTIKTLSVAEGQNVKAGDVLLILSSPALERDLLKENATQRALQTRLRQARIGDAAQRAEIVVIEEEMAAVQQRLTQLKSQRDSLTVTAPFDGIIRDLSPTLRRGMTVGADHLLLTLVNPSELVVSGYVNEYQRNRLQVSQTGVFFPDFSWSAKADVILENIADIHTNTISWPSLTSPYGGPIVGSLSPHAQQDAVTPRDSVYKVRLHAELSASDKDDAALTSLAIRGKVRLRAKSERPVFLFFKRALATLAQEVNLN